MSEYIGVAVLLGLNMGIYLVIFWLLSTIKIDIDRYLTGKTAKDDNEQNKAIKGIKFELALKMGVLAFVLFMNLILCGYIYYFSEQIAAVLAKMAFVYIALNLVAFMVFIVLGVMKTFAFPLEMVKEIFDEHKLKWKERKY